MANELYKQIGSPDVYVKGAEGKLQHIKDPEAFKAGGFDWKNITELPQAAFQKLKSRLGVGEQLTAADLTAGVASPTLPEKEPFDASPTKNGIDAFYKSQQEQIASTIKAIQEREKQMAEQQAQLQETQRTWKERLFGQPSMTQIQAQQMEQFGIPEQLQQQQALITDIGTLREKLDKLDVEMQNQIALNEQKPVSTRVMDREEARIRETYSRQMAGISASLNAKAATLQALQGNLAQARSFANMAVNAAIYDQEQEFKRFEFFYNENKDFINSLDKSQQRDLDRLLNYQKEELDRLRAEKEQVATLMLQYNGAGINMDMSLDEAAQAAAYLQEVVAPSQEAAIMGLIRQGITDPAKIYDYVNFYEDGTPLPGAPISMETITKVLSRQLDIAQQQAQIARTQQLVAGGEAGEKTVPWSLTAALAGLVGLPKSQAQDVLSSKTVPDWFVQQAIPLFKDISPSPSTIQRLWEEYVKEPREKVSKQNAVQSLIQSAIISAFGAIK